MADPVGDPAYWQERLALTRADHKMPPYLWEYTALYCCDPPLWERIADRHREILARHVGSTDSVLDAGCAWGRLLELMPSGWHGAYVGVDLSPDFVRIARERWGNRTFFVHDLRGTAPWAKGCFDWAVCVSMRDMIRDNLGAETWGRIEAKLRHVARRVLLLEYEPDDEGVVL